MWSVSHEVKLPEAVFSNKSNSMKRPAALTFTPPPLSQSIYYRFYHDSHSNYPDLFSTAKLRLCPRVSMHDLVPGDIISGNIAFNGFYEWKLSKMIVSLANRGGVFVDVGANMGYFSLLWAGINPSGRVIGFEAAPRNITLFQKNVAINNLSDRITIIPKAAGHYAGEIAFDIGPAEQTGWGGISASSTSNSISVPVVRLDAELADLEIDVLKIDVEGADTWVLYGCEQLLKKKKIHRIFFEQNKKRIQELGIRLNEAEIFLRDLGYTCTPFGKGRTEWMAMPEFGE